MVNVPPLPKAAVHDPNFPNALILAPFGNPGHKPSSPFFGTGSPAFVQPILSIAFCSAAAFSFGPNFELMLKDLVATSRASAMCCCRCSMTI